MATTDPSALKETTDTEYLGKKKNGIFIFFWNRFDLAGRVFKGVPAPRNLVIPPYKFISPTRLLIGDDSEAV